MRELRVHDEEAEGAEMTHVWVYYDTNKQMGDEGHLVIFASGEAADEWLAIHDPEGVFWSYPIVDRINVD